MGIGEIEIIIALQKRANSPNFKKGINFNYILCTIFFVILHFKTLVIVLRLDFLVGESTLQQYITIIQSNIDLIPPGVIIFFIFWILITLIFSIKSISKREDEQTEKSKDRIKGVKDPKCLFVVVRWIFT